MAGFVYKELTLAVRQDNGLKGIKVKGFQGDIDFLTESLLEFPEDIEKIKESVANKGGIFTDIKEYQEVKKEELATVS